MALKDTFCAGPWFHVSVMSDGSLRRCRWHQNKTLYNEDFGNYPNIRDTSPVQFFREGMSDMRVDMLEGRPHGRCSECYKVDQHGKISGRQRQLLKAGVQVQQFAKTMWSSPMLPQFRYSHHNLGGTDLVPLDYQIDLGNHCNGKCVFCGPAYSSSLATEYKKLGWIEQPPPTSWATDETVWQFVNEMEEVDQDTYMHFLGGETLITPAFKTFLQSLIDRGWNSRITIGLTTNLTVWRQDVIDLLCQFSNVHVGMSVECLTTLNDYVRYPSDINTVRSLLDRWQSESQQHGWLNQLRITPTCLSISHLLSIYEYAAGRGMAIESCNFIGEPVFMRLNVLPMDMRQPIIDSFQAWLLDTTVETGTVINTRNPHTTQAQNAQDLQSYVRYLEQEPHDADGARQLAQHLRTLESVRHNRILDYLPEYEQFLRTAGY